MSKHSNKGSSGHNTGHTSGPPNTLRIPERGQTKRTNNPRDEKVKLPSFLKPIFKK